MNIVEKFLPQEYFSKLKGLMFSSNFPWYYSPYTSLRGYGPSKIYNGTFSNLLYFKFQGELVNNLNFFNIDPILKNLSELVGYQIELVRMRAGLITTTPHRITHGAHTDFFFPHKTAVIYMNSCENAPTILYDAFYNHTLNLIPDSEQFIKICEEVQQNAPYVCSECVENNLVLFNGLQFHSSTTPVLEDRRIALNINFI